MKATERYYNERAKENLNFWTNVLMGQHCCSVTEDQICSLGVKESTFRQQLRDEFFTKKEGELLYFARKREMLYA